MILGLKGISYRLRFDFIFIESKLKNRDEERAFADSSPRGHFVP